MPQNVCLYTTREVYYSCMFLIRLYYIEKKVSDCRKIAKRFSHYENFRKNYSNPEEKNLHAPRYQMANAFILGLLFPKFLDPPLCAYLYYHLFKASMYLGCILKTIRSMLIKLGRWIA